MIYDINKLSFGRIYTGNTSNSIIPYFMKGREERWDPLWEQVEASLHEVLGDIMVGPGVQLSVLAWYVLLHAEHQKGTKISLSGADHNHLEHSVDL